ncbi:hypothetical protein KSC_094320 [Ktedonobacter sp. SOSP1-52]|uniref:serine/threonine protein kinase n=1 Tax=Ktedonobacter sp. SOSP1-52 TaxID=2778366 RepID=UPI001916120F|nr:serine/threonine-protein kinase [Ktedonobacter sp. SOSP1-52]GHO70540.1 hypothetical protein KSC_094320 [Ktedonobacter sp. SOSP1-52]
MYVDLPAENILYERYMVDEVLGEGGFGSVYRVRDMQDNDQVYALKEVSIRQKTEWKSVQLEAELLKQLDHYAIPRFYGMVEDPLRMRAGILMSYIAGPNLESLRRQQPEKRFKPAQVFSMMTPIVDAIIYLHRQTPSIVHRDIKPANIIMPALGQGAVLVDFGIAKVYEQDSTTSIHRVCSAGYSAPEQYMTGTCPQTDIYSLGATFYTLLTGEVPADALTRLSHISTHQADPLVPVLQLASNLPEHIAEAIECALAMEPQHRFTSVSDFWQALHTPLPIGEQPTRKRPVPEAIMLGTPANSSISRVATQAHTLQRSSQTKTSQERPWNVHRGLAALALVVVLALILGTMIYATAQQATARDTHAQTITPTSAPSMYSALANYYTGTMTPKTSIHHTALTLSQVQQHSASFNGTLSMAGQPGSLHIEGTTAIDHTLQFNVASNSGTLLFKGQVYPDGHLAGSYCPQTQSTACGTGTWSATPTSPPPTPTPTKSVTPPPTQISGGGNNKGNNNGNKKKHKGEGN